MTSRFQNTFNDNKNLLDPVIIKDYVNNEIIQDKHYSNFKYINRNKIDLISPVRTVPNWYLNKEPTLPPVIPDYQQINDPSNTINLNQTILFNNYKQQSQLLNNIKSNTVSSGVNTENIQTPPAIENSLYPYQQRRNAVVPETTIEPLDPVSLTDPVQVEDTSVSPINNFDRQTQTISNTEGNLGRNIRRGSFVAQRTARIARRRNTIAVPKFPTIPVNSSSSFSSQGGLINVNRANAFVNIDNRRASPAERASGNLNNALNNL